MTAAARAHASADRPNERRSRHEPSTSKTRAAPKRLEARASLEIYAYIEHAAVVSGRSLTDLMLAGTMREARDAIEQANVLRLSRDAQIRFAEALVNPPSPNAALLQASELYDRLVVPGSVAK